MEYIEIIKILRSSFLSEWMESKHTQNIDTIFFDEQFDFEGILSSVNRSINSSKNRHLEERYQRIILHSLARQFANILLQHTFNNDVVTRQDIVFAQKELKSKGGGCSIHPCSR
ncbi:hypothetical protein Q5H92_00865 [Hymenobacter sp. M29]|uniref:Clp ATPase C-terminal domain-containing protein n=1 Tax=Hymenobacter mellowenesis TaxID=3063995 RepID=A0ABT9A4X9_9BACT|nr:hypothetical protein [Hymenobacter sp. M29]MDO7844890.1 hypothetical protein [Hymenobacter sp. M29]